MCRRATSVLSQEHSLYNMCTDRVDLKILYPELSTHLASGWAARVVLVALVLANPCDFPLEPNRAMERSPPERNGRMREFLQFLGLSTVKMSPGNMQSWMGKPVHNLRP